MKDASVWDCWALWPGLKPIYMGKVLASSEFDAWGQASESWPQVPTWRLE